MTLAWFFRPRISGLVTKTVQVIESCRLVPNKCGRCHFRSMKTKRLPPVSEEFESFPTTRDVRDGTGAYKSSFPTTCVVPTRIHPSSHITWYIAVWVIFRDILWKRQLGERDAIGKVWHAATDGATRAALAAQKTARRPILEGLSTTLLQVFVLQLLG